MDQDDYEVIAWGTVDPVDFEALMQQRIQEADIFNSWKCCNCGTDDINQLEEGPTWFVCLVCGACQQNMGVHMVFDPPAEELPKGLSHFVAPKRDRNGKIIKARVCYGGAVRRRYKREFYYRERLAQWMCTEPPLKPRITEKFLYLLWSGAYGSKRHLSRGSVLQMCKDNQLCKYKENWKSILRYLRDEETRPLENKPDAEILDECARLFSVISRRFDEMPKSEMGKFLHGSKGKNRHHILHVNYIHRKILETMDIYDYHREFPLLRTPSKIHALDDVMQVICKELDLPFTRTAVVLPPKCKNRFKKKASHSFSVCNNG
jgi:hypothetical protein